MTLLLVDDREPEWVPRKLQARLGDAFQVDVVRLQAGDILCPAGGIAFERKTVGDFLASIQTGRLAAQVPDLCAAARLPVVLLVGSLLESEGKVVADGRATQWNWWSVQCSILSLQARGALFVHASDRLWAETVGALASWAVRKAEEHLTVSRPRLVLDASPEVAFLSALPGIGPVHANALLDYAGSPAWALTALTTPELRIPGIGDGTRHKVRRFLGLLDGQQLSVMEGG